MSCNLPDPMVRFTCEKCSYDLPVASSVTLESGEVLSRFYFLTDDILEKVLGLIPSMHLITSTSLVCRRWNRLSKFCVKDLGPWVFPNLMYRLFPNFGGKFFQIALKFSSSLESLALFRQHDLDVPKLLILLSNLSKLKKFALVGCKRFASDDLLSVLCLLPPTLQSIDVHQDHFSTPCCHSCTSASLGYFEDAHLLVLSQRCPNLRHINLDYCSHFSFDALKHLLICCRSLTSLHLHNDSMGWREVGSILIICTSLQHLSFISPRLVGLADETEAMDLETRLFRSIRVRKLSFFAESLAIHAYFKIMLSSISSTASPSLALLKPPEGLKSLKLFVSPHQSVRWESAIISPFLKKMGSRLDMLIAHGSSFRSWYKIAMFCPNLTSLDLSRSSLMCHLSEIEEMSLMGCLQFWPNLLRLALPSATENVLRTCGLYLKQLRELRIQSNGPDGYFFSTEKQMRDQVTCIGIRYLAKGCTRLHTLVLSDCKNIGVDAVRAISQCCTQLRDLQLSDCFQLGDEIFPSLKNLLTRNLQVLNLEKTRVTQTFLCKLLDVSMEKKLQLKLMVLNSALRKQHHIASALVKNIPGLVIRSSKIIVPSYCTHHDMLLYRRFPEAFADLLFIEAGTPWDGFDTSDDGSII